MSQAKPETTADPTAEIVEQHPESERPSSTLEAMLDEHVLDTRERASANPRPGGIVIGECLDPRHPTLLGRVRVRWRDPDGTKQERWLPTLMGLPVRAADRVMLLRPDDGSEPIVTGVIDGYAKRPELERSTAGQLEIKRDEALRIVGTDGEPLIEVFQGESGPVVRLIHDDLELAVPGKLRIRAKDVKLQAEQGQVELEATDDVVVRGEVIRLN